MFSAHTIRAALLCVSAFFPYGSFGIPAKNHPTPVNLRIEGADKTIFEGTIVTMGHNVTTVSGGTHHCDGTNDKANEFPGPTCTSALDDASKETGFQWDGTFSTEFDDYFITSIGDSTETDSEFWGLLLNFKFTPVGGCQQEVDTTDHILWAFNAFNAKHFLKLVGPTKAKKNIPTKFVVTDGMTGDPVQGATVDGGTSNARGVVIITFGKEGTHGLKATMDGSIRSNQLQVDVY
ncbi:Surface cell-adhesion protein [Mycena sanguinolenta]|uniref:Surface cell-adhesion protein n=1 Tax=Mycena sanguinolenta TaxID=230812 RepID=A0A8H6XJA9_9AGAR|nr:Surface cell-adhesion protein [Mycena sanguinolenta]